jgi:HK97 family phage major capsid protein
MSNKVEAENLRVSRMCEIIAEQEVLEAKKQMTAQDELRHRRLSQEFSVLKAGVSVQEFYAARTAALQKEVGGNVPALPREAVEQWRSLAQNNGLTEFRVDSQATSQWGNVTGVSTDHSGGVLVPSTKPYTADRIYAMLAQYDEVTDYGQVWTSDNGSAGVVPFVKDYTVTGSPAVAAFNKSVVADEAYQSSTTQFATDKLAFGKVPTFRSGRLAIALEIATDAPDLFAMTTALAEACFAQRFALGYGARCVNYILSNLPTAQNVTTNANNSIQLTDVLSLWSALPQVYRRDAVIICSDTVRAQITAAFEAAARTMVGPVLEVLRTPIAVSPSMPAFAAGQVGAVMVSQSRLIHRRTNGGNIIRKYKEAAGLIEQGLSAVEHFGRADFAVVGLNDPYFPSASVLNVHA